MVVHLEIVTVFWTSALSFVFSKWRKAQALMVVVLDYAELFILIALSEVKETLFLYILIFDLALDSCI